MNKGTVTVAAAVAAILGYTMPIERAQAQTAPAPNGAQDPAASTSNSDEALGEVTITGLRRSLQEAMEIKRDAIGVVDAISAEDIGKFADSNLSEALQRITGISIDRRNGEGALVTARGFGAQYNMVTLNGRQMPSADAYGGNVFNNGGFAGNSRSFNFANLASEAISGIEVYKTSRADIATGGIGASINIKTARPFDNTGTVANVGFKAVNDQSNRVGNDITPEVSGIFSFTDDDRRWGVGLTASYQKRDSGAMGAAINDWHIESWSADPAVNKTTSQIVENASITDAPAAGTLYGIPDDMRYSFSDRERERTNGQLTVQFAPVDTLTLTADYTYALNKLKEDRGEQAIWMSRNGFTALDFDVGQSVATPEILHEGLTGTNKDFAFEQQHREQKNDLKSLGFNAAWEMNDRLSFGLDYHDSKARSLPDDPLTGGGETLFSIAGKVPSTCTGTVCTNYWTQTFMFNNSLPIAARTLYPNSLDAAAGVNGNSNFTFDENSIGTQMLRINYQDQITDIRQGRLDGALKFDNGRIQFGVETRAMDMSQRGSQGVARMGDWGVDDAGRVPSLLGLAQPFSLVNAFKDFSAPGAPTNGWRANADTLAQWALANKTIDWNQPAAPDGQLGFNPGFDQNNAIAEDTDAVYVQFAMQRDLGAFPANLVVGARYESTDVTSTSEMLVPTALVWEDNNDFRVDRQTQVSPVARSTDYNNLLPSLDFDLKVTENIKTRLSWSKSLARANYGQLTAGVDVGGPGGSTGLGFRPPATANNPVLQPLESNNLDLAVEYYFSNRGYVSLTFWDKRVDNFIGNAVSDENLFDLRDPTAGQRAQAALAFLTDNNFAVNDSTLFTAMVMAENPGTFVDGDGVTWTGGLDNFTGNEQQHLAFATKYDIAPNSSDPLYNFAVSRPVNNKKARIYGWEMGGQYFFGDTGFGVLANYTLVKGDVGYDNASDPDQNQFALLGLSDSANAVLMYEKFGFTVRLAYNWRDEFLSNINVGTWRSPVYVEEYDQVDLSVGYDFNDNLSMSFEGLNLTGNDVRWHGRSDKQLWFLEDQSARFALGARYRF
jgi:TonB-dependent receptor